MLIIVSALAVQDVRERPIEKAQSADTAHEMFVDEQSDFLSVSEPVALDRATAF